MAVEKEEVKKPKKILKEKTLKADIFQEFDKDAIKKEISLVKLFKHFGVNLNQKGENYIGFCPFHEALAPSLSVSEDRGLFNCFECGESGDAFHLVQKIKEIDYHETKKYLLNWKKEERANAKKEPAGREEGPEENESDSLTLPENHPLNLCRIAEYYHKQFYSNSEAQNYLKAKGFNNPALISRYQIGFADGSLSGKISKKQKEELKKSGLYDSRGRETFKGSITFPLYSESGEITGLYGQSMTEGKESEIYFYPTKVGLFNYKALKAYSKIILTDNMIDAFSLLQTGLQNVTTCYHSKGFSSFHLSAMKESGVKEIILAFNENAKEAANDLNIQLQAEGFTVKMIFPQSGKSWNGALLEGLSKENIEQLIKNAPACTHENKRKEFDVSVNYGTYTFTINQVVYRLTGVKETFVNNLKVTVKASYQDDFFVDTVDLCSYRSRLTLSNHLSSLFNIEAKRIERDLLEILEYLEQKRDVKLQPETEPEKPLTEEEKERGLAFLKSPSLFEEIVKDLTTLGYVGEELNKILIYLCASSRKLDNPISVLIVSQSASGKSYLVDTVKRLIPPDDVISITTLSDQALNYMKDLEHKFLVFGEAVHNETIEHLIREMLSSKELSRWVTVKDEKTGEMSTKQIKKDVIVASVMSTTNHRMNPENASRFFMINTDESKEQTKRIYFKQSEKNKLSRYLERENIIPDVISKHHIAQRLLKKIPIVNNFADQIEFPDNVMRLRRDHDRFLDLIAVICFVRQYQKEIKKTEGLSYIECDLTDYETAYKIMIEGVLSSTINDLPLHVVTFYEEVRDFIERKSEKEQLSPLEISFTQREIREATGLNHTFVKRCIRQLVDHEYLNQKGSGARGARQSYSLMANEKLQSIDISMIPSPEEMRKKMNK